MPFDDQLQAPLDDSSGRGSSFQLVNSNRCSQASAMEELEEPPKPHCCRRCCKKRYMVPMAAGCAFGMAVVCLLVGLLVPGYLDTRIDHQAEVCSSDSPGYDRWITDDPENDLGVSGPFVPRFRNFWAWNLTNPVEYLKGAKAILQETGPYAYLEYTTKFDISFAETSQKYRMWNRLEYSPENSCASCSEHDPITMLNPVYLEAITKTGGETNFMLSAGVPTLAKMLLCPTATTAEDKFKTYAAASCPNLPTTVDQDTLGKELTCCALGSTGNAIEMLKSLEAGTAEDKLDTLLTGCGFTTTQAERAAVLSCSLSYWGATQYNPGSNNLLDQAKVLVQELILPTDGLVVTKTVHDWYIGGPSTIANLINPGCNATSGGPQGCWPGFGIRHYPELVNASSDPENSYQEVGSGCNGALVDVGNYKMAYGAESVDHSYWGFDISVPVSGSNNQQTVPRGNNALNSDDNGPYSTTVYEWCEQLKRAVALDFEGGTSYKGVHLNRFSIPKSELSGTAVARIPGLERTVYNYELGVGQLPGHAFANIAGVVDLSPYEGFPAFVTMPHYFQADPILQDFAQLIPSENSNGEYGTYMDIEPASGLTFRGHQRLQVNTLVNKTADGQVMTNIFYPNVQPQQLISLYWIDQQATITDHDLSKFKTLQSMHDAAKWTLYLGPATAGLLAVLLTIWSLHLRRMCCFGEGLPRDSTFMPYQDATVEEGRGSSFLSSNHSKLGYPEEGTWSERCSLAQEYAKSCTEKIGGCTRGRSTGDIIDRKDLESPRMC